MKTTYNKLSITPSCAHDDFTDIIFSLGVEAVERDGDSLIVRTENSIEMVVFGIESFATALEEKLKKPIHLSIVHSIESNEDWIQSYRASIKPVEAKDIYVYPSWEKPKLNKINVCIDPALAFGSGHHETTHGCLLALQKYLPSNATLLDVGCGSGILAISAIKLGAKASICDTDEVAVMSAISNAKLNNISFESSWVGSIDKADKSYDLVIANIVADVLIMLSNQLQEALKPGGILILSGILEKYASRIEEKFNELDLRETLYDNEWCTMIFMKGN
ncbi:MAG: 50S ribosomal protein L11 methyltransferase [Campylobacteraceae bacterium]|nr:50S ribosomal protein L11 methyltransferase [Campylobacteraceae bacterium]